MHQAPAAVTRLKDELRVRSTHMMDGLIWSLELGFLILWIVYEAAPLSTWGSTPDEALMKIRVRDVHGNKLTFGVALKGSFGILFFGLGLGLPLASMIAQIWAYQRLFKKQRVRDLT